MRNYLLLGLLLFVAAASSAQQKTTGPTYRFVVTDYPPNTPHDAQLFITGTFNKWNPGNPAYQLKHQSDGTYTVSIQSNLDKLEYKFTRGDWSSVEGRDSGKARVNRVVYRAATGVDQEVDITIQSWEDLSGTFHFYSLYDLLMLFAAFQGLLLLIAIPGIQNNNQTANRWLSLLLGLTSVLILVRTVAAYRDVAQAYTKLLLLPDLLLFLYGPLLYIYLRKLLFNTARPASGWWRHFVPAIIQVLVYMPFLLTDNKELQLKIVNRDPWLQGVFLTVGVLALVYNCFYWRLCWRALRTYRNQHDLSQSTEPQVHYLNTVLGILAVCLGLWAFFFVLIGTSSLASFDTIAIAERYVDFIWLTLSSIVYLLGYYAIHQPELFKLPDTEHLPLLETAPLYTAGQELNVLTKPLDAGVNASVPLSIESQASVADDSPRTTDEIEATKRQIDIYMLRYKPFTNPNLTLAELAAKLKMPPHVLSKVLNEGYDKNFFDFINTHRINELKVRLHNPQFRSYTLLSMALEVGFNSKTAFNRSFKKLTNQTPSEYLNTHTELIKLAD
ncbi:helix-turn-helix domain-containing protein [Fibrella sp. HMF5335]|uniref:Helix-turn-helix domain-containing protein n=1 Tax=Fibrella rubiginis TaxID=2817060 RepID=A0A939K319_9BACT|nr:helix-turn-helix domain-containing protein [Fibrella rubiginis]MBO0936909.1 helix-turn-helix domain-containing protein [Fibrella rubiginis]